MPTTSAALAAHRQHRPTPRTSRDICRDAVAIEQFARRRTPRGHRLIIPVCLLALAYVLSLLARGL